MSTARAAVPLAASRWVATAVSRVLQQRHPGSALAPLTLPPPSAASTDDLIEAIARHRVIPLLTPWADPLGLPPDAVAKLQALRRQEHLLGLANIVGTVTAAQALSVAGVDHLVVKGVCLPALSHRQPAARGRGDVDVWVRASDLGAAESALARAGWRRSEQHRTLPHQGDGWRWGILVRFSYELTLTHPRHSDVDLHWRLGHVGREFSFSFEQALSQSVALPAVGQGVRTLAPLQALEHLAQHGRKEAWPTLRHLVDIIELSECCGLQRVRDLARRQVQPAPSPGHRRPPVSRSDRRGSHRSALHPARGRGLGRLPVAHQGARGSAAPEGSCRGDISGIHGLVADAECTQLAREVESFSLAGGSHWCRCPSPLIAGPAALLSSLPAAAPAALCWPPRSPGRVRWEDGP